MTEQPERIAWTNDEHEAVSNRWIGRAVLFWVGDGTIRSALVMGVSEPPAWGSDPMLDLIAVRVHDNQEPGLDFYSDVQARRDHGALVRQRPELGAELNARQSWMPIPWPATNEDE